MPDLDEESIQFVRKLRKQQIYPEGVGVSVRYGIEEVERLIPHRPPMRLVDGIDAVDLEGQKILGRRTLDPADPIFEGHFPGHPVYPGVLQVEAMGQVALCLASLLPRNSVEIPADFAPVAIRALRIIHAQYLEPLEPGNVLALHASILEEDGMTATVAGQIIKQGRVASLSLQEVYFVE